MYPTTIESSAILDKIAAESQILASRQEIKYYTRNYSIRHIIEKYTKKLETEQNSWYIPDYQRDFVWDKKKRSKFIESVLLRIPISPIFAVEVERARLEIVDGSQRIRTLASFYNNEFKLQKLETLTKLEGFYFNDLSEDTQESLLDLTGLDVIILDSSTSPDVKEAMFERINTSELLKDMEIRRGIYKGHFNQLIRECAQTLKSQNLAPIGSFFKLRKEEEELIVHFFALSETFNANFSFTDKDGKTISRSSMGMTKYLDKFYQNQNIALKKLSAEEREKEIYRLKTMFESMLDFVKNNFPLGFKRYYNAPNTSRSYFEAISVGTYLALQENINLAHADTSFVNTDQELKKELSGKYGLNNPERIKSRITIIKNNLLGI
jgi:hypothetical protein